MKKRILIFLGLILSGLIQYGIREPDQRPLPLGPATGLRERLHQLNHEPEVAPGVGPGGSFEWGNANTNMPSDAKNMLRSMTLTSASRVERKVRVTTGLLTFH